LQKEAEARGAQLTLAEVKAHLDKMLQATGSHDAKVELRALVPDWQGGRPAGRAWRKFAEEFRMLAAYNPELTEAEKREHLMVHCLSQNLQGVIAGENRRRSTRPKAAMAGFQGLPSAYFKNWLLQQGVDCSKVATMGAEHSVVCESGADLGRLMALDGCHVEVAGGVVVLRVRRVENELTAAEILDLITERLVDEEAFNDARRGASRAANAAHTSGAASPRRRVQVLEVEDEEDGESEWAAEVAAIESRGPGQAQGTGQFTSKSPTPPSAAANKDLGKSDAVNGGAKWHAVPPHSTLPSSTGGQATEGAGG